MFVNINDSPDEKKLNWIEFGPQLVLREVIIGAQCHPAESKRVEEAVKAYGEALRCWWAGMRRDAFLLVKELHPPPCAGEWETERVVAPAGSECATRSSSDGTIGVVLNACSAQHAD